MTELDNLTIIDQTRPDQTRPDQTTYDFLYDKEDYLQPHRLNTNHLEDKALSFRVINGSYVLPFPDSVEDGSGMFSNDGLYVKGSSLWNGGIYTADYASLSAIADKRRLDLSRVPRKNQTVIFAGTLLNIWGHFITDCMRLIWFLRSQECTEKFSGLQVIYIPDAMFKMSGNHKRFLEIMGIDTSRMIPVTELTFYDKVILPDECFFLRKDGERFFTREYVDMFNTVRDFAAANAKPTTSDRIYYSYSRYKNGKVFGEDKLEKYFASKGYRIISPETLSLDEQLNVLANAKSFASTVGSCSQPQCQLRGLVILNFHGQN